MCGCSSRKMWADKLLGKNIPKCSNIIRPRHAYNGCVLGIDPSLRGTGVALVRVQQARCFELLHSETVHIPAARSLEYCAGKIFSAIDNILKLNDVQHVALEQTIYVQNRRTAQAMGAARGAAMACVGLRNLRGYEYPPLRIKQAVVGFGRASKEQVARTVQQMLRLPHALSFDESDAVAAALCHAFTFVE